MPAKRIAGLEHALLILLLCLSGCDAQSLTTRALFDVCDDKQPRGGHSCEQQKSWGKCTEQWFVDGKYCRRTCGRCVDFDPRTTEMKLRRAMRACSIVDEQTIEACLSMFQGKSPGISSGLRVHMHESSSQSSLEELLESPTFHNSLIKCKVDCTVKESSDQLVYAVVENFLEEHGPKSEKMGDLLKPENAAKILLDFFKHIGCSVDQFVALGPAVYRTLLESNALDENQLVLKMYQLSAVAGGNETITFTSQYRGHPSVSTCLGKNLKLLLSVRSCQDYHCYN